MNVDVPGSLSTGRKFLETIRLLDGVPQHLEWHQSRMEATLRAFFRGHQHAWALASCIHVPSEFTSGVVRCRIIYDAHQLSIHYDHYKPGITQTLKIVDAPPGFDYRYKYADRKVLEELHGQRESAADILISRDGLISDTSIANVAFQKNGRWYTPLIPLLAGTTWKRLIHKGILIPKPINQKDLLKFDTFIVFNAMNSFETALEFPVSNIR